MGEAKQFDVLQRIAAFSAKVRGHELGEWHSGEDSAVASCIRCHSELRLYYSPIQPEMDGAVLDGECGKEPAAERAA